MTDTDKYDIERIDAHEHERILEADDALPRPLKCHRTGEELEYHESLIFLENGEPVAEKRFADEVAVGIGAGGHFRNTGPSTSWVNIKDRTDLPKSFLSRLRERIARFLPADTDQ